MADEKAATAPGRRTAARTRAESHFAAAERRDIEVRKEIEKERTATATRTAKLRALRLAKEEADRAATPAPISKPRRKKTIKAS